MSCLELKHTRRGKYRYRNKTERVSRSWCIQKRYILVSHVSLTHGGKAVGVDPAFWAAIPSGHGKVLMKYKALLGWLTHHKYNYWRKGQHGAAL